MNKRLVIVGAGGFGREVLAWVSSSPAWREKAGVGPIVFIDDNAFQLAAQAATISTVRAYLPEPGDAFVCAIGSPSIRREIVAALERKGAKTLAFVDDRVTLGDGVSVEPGAIICPEVTIAAGVSIGRNVHLNIRSTLGRDVVIKDFATVSPSCTLGEKVVVGESVFIGAAATISPGLMMGENSRVGAGAVVVGDVEPWSTVVGSPARKLKEVP